MTANITIETTCTRNLDAAARAAVVALCTEAHEADFCPLFSFLPDDGLHIRAFAGPELVGHAVVTTRWLQPEGMGLLRTAYVDAVSTRPAHQGRGIGSAVMRHLAASIADYEIACLETDRVSFYTRLGWEPWRGPLGGRKDGALILTPDQEGILILRLPLTPPLDLDSLLTIEHQGRIW